MTIAPSGIYVIKNIKNNKMYVGQSQNVFERKIQHFTALNNHHHKNEELQKDWNKFGPSAFTWKVLEYCSLTRLNEREIHWINKLDTLKPNGYNDGWVPYCRKEKIEIKPKYKQKRYRKRS